MSTGWSARRSVARLFPRVRLRSVAVRGSLSARMRRRTFE